MLILTQTCCRFWLTAWEDSTVTRSPEIRHPSVCSSIWQCSLFKASYTRLLNLLHPFQACGGGGRVSRPSLEVGFILCFYKNSSAVRVGSNLTLKGWAFLPLFVFVLLFEPSLPPKCRCGNIQMFSCCCWCFFSKKQTCFGGSIHCVWGSGCHLNFCLCIVFILNHFGLLKAWKTS